jgi:hypothetical protein
MLRGRREEAEAQATLDALSGSRTSRCRRCWWHEDDVAWPCILHLKEWLLEDYVFTVFLSFALIVLTAIIFGFLFG